MHTRIFHLLSVGLLSIGLLGTACTKEAKSSVDSALVWDTSGLADVLPEPIHGETVIQGLRGRLIMDRSFARPQDRWLDIRVELDQASPEQTLSVEYFDPAHADKKVTLDPVKAAPKNLLRVDARALPNAQGMVRIQVLENGKPVDVLETVVTSKDAEHPFQAGDKIPVKVDFPADSKGGSLWPVSFGVPFGAGQLWDASHLRLEDSEGKAVPFQSEVTAHWIPDGSIQWVRFDAQVRPGETFFVTTGKAETSPDPIVSVVEKGGVYTIDTGVSRYVVGEGNSPIREIYLGDRRVASTEKSRGMYLIDQKGQLATAAKAASVKVEAKGPVTASVRVEGDYVTAKGEVLAHYIVRIEAFAGQKFARVTHTFVLNKDSNETWFKELGWEFDVYGESHASGIFALSEEDSMPLEPGREIVLFQESVKGIRAEKNVFQLLSIEAGKENILKTGNLIGDWFAWRSKSDGLMISVRDAALNAPKEFSLSADRMNVLLFSARAGEEMDFRSATLAKVWEHEMKSRDVFAKKWSEPDVAKFPSNAIGWAKTHDLLLSPFSAETSHAELASQSRLESQKVFAHVDPHWIYQTNVFGPLYPRDPARFPQPERFLDLVMQGYMEQVPGDRYTGFFDYYAGPVYASNGRYRNTYTLFDDAWLMYARSGDRKVREFAEGTNRAFRDNYVAHWDSDKKKKGLFIHIDGKTIVANLPLYWESEAAFQMTTTSNINKFLLDYYMTGDRRSKDVVEEIAEGFKTHWKPGTKDWRIFQLMRTLRQLYEFTGDRQFLVSLEKTANASAYDPEGMLLLTKDRPYNSTTYKTPTDMKIMMENAESFGSKRWEEMATRTAQFWFQKYVGLSPLFRISGDYLNFLYNENPDAVIPQMIDYNLRYASASVDPETGTKARGVGFSTLDNVLKGLPYGMDVVARTDSDRKSLASLVQFDDYGTPGAIYLKKDNEKPLTVWVQPAFEKNDSNIVPVGVAIKGIGQIGLFGQDAIQVQQFSSQTGTPGGIKITFPKDAIGGTYRITPTQQGVQFAIADSLVPMVFAPQGYWRPTTFSPPYRYYFHIPKDGQKSPAIFFEAQGRLFKPDGKEFRAGEKLTGWIELPSDEPGLWAFEPTCNGLISTRNLPPYFSMHRAESWFDPMDEEDLSAASAHPEEESESAEVKGQELTKGNDLVISGSASSPLPYKQGTIEFFFKPHWDTFSLRQGDTGVTMPLFKVLTDKDTWNLMYRIDPKGSNINLGPTDPSHAFYANFWTRNPRNHTRVELRSWNTRKILEKDAWVHVAFVWGIKDIPGSHKKATVPYARIFVNGMGDGRTLGYTNDGSVPEGIPQEIRFSGSVNGELAFVRVSDIPRYDSNFQPPNITDGLKKDSHTNQTHAYPKETQPTHDSSN